MRVLFDQGTPFRYDRFLPATQLPLPPMKVGANFKTAIFSTQPKPQALTFY
jgi:hypothetical protein